MPRDVNYADEQCLLHLKSSRQSGIAELSAGSSFVNCVPLIELKFYDGQHQLLKTAFD